MARDTAETFSPFLLHYVTITARSVNLWCGTAVNFNQDALRAQRTSLSMHCTPSFNSFNKSVRSIHQSGSDSSSLANPIFMRKTAGQNVFNSRLWRWSTEHGTPDFTKR